MNMDIAESVRQVLQLLQTVSWGWSKPEALKAIAPLQPQPSSKVPGRGTFTVMGSLPLSIYHEGESIERVEITLDQFDDPELLTELEYDDKVDEFFEKFESAVSGAAAVLGKPRFNDGAGSRGFPEDEDAVWLALWPLETVRVMVQQRHEDKELPFILSLVFTPPGK